MAPESAARDRDDDQERDHHDRPDGSAQITSSFALWPVPGPDEDEPRVVSR
jgi:hypothetical protein